MKNTDDIESYLIGMDASFEAIGDNIWVVKDSGPDIVVSIAGPLVVFRVKLLDDDKVPDERRRDLYRSLLELNATEMIHGAYGLEEGRSLRRPPWSWKTSTSTNSKPRSRTWGWPSASITNNWDASRPSTQQ